CARGHGRADLRPDGDGRGGLRGRRRPWPDRRHLPAAAADRRRRAPGAARLSITTFGWLVLIFPLAGAILIGLTFKMLPSRLHGVIGTLAILLSFLSAVGMFLKLQDRAEGSKQVVSVAWNYANTVGID